MNNFPHFIHPYRKVHAKHPPWRFSTSLIRGEGVYRVVIFSIRCSPIKPRF